MPVQKLPAIILFAATPQVNKYNLRKDHDTIRVKNLQTSADFYGNILGLEEIPNGGLGDHIKWFQLNDRVQLHLVESDEVIEKNKGVHMAMRTDLLDAFMDYLKSKNIPFETWKGEPGTSNTRPDGIRQIYFQDPDGYWMEVNDGRH
ncbi:MAG TPA: VOC family protein [Salegentibacter sp.]|nr:VOC family protein [Salegentibacter sp.]